MVWDRYFEDSLKGTTRGKGVRRRVVPRGAIPLNWKNLLRVESNKTELFKFLSEALHKSFAQEKQLDITDGESILSEPPLHDLCAHSPCSHEEADCACYYVHHAARHGHQIIAISDFIHKCCVAGRVSVTKFRFRIRTLASLWNWQAFPILGSP